MISDSELTNVLKFIEPFLIVYLVCCYYVGNVAHLSTRALTLNGGSTQQLMNLNGLADEFQSIVQLPFLQLLDYVCLMCQKSANLSNAVNITHKCPYGFVNLN